MFILGAQDIRFLLSRVRGEFLPEEQGGLAPLGPTGMRDVQGVGNITTDPQAPAWWFGASDTLFLRWTYNRLNTPNKKSDVISQPFADSTRGSTVIINDTATVGGQTVDALNPRNISNLISDSSSPVGFQSAVNANQLNLQLLDNPTGRISPVSGAVNPLPYSNWTSQFGQFFDHGLDFVSKGVDGTAKIELLPSDSLFARTQSNDPNVKFMSASRNNTVNVTIGEGSTDSLLTKLGIPLIKQGQASWEPLSTVVDPTRNGTYAFEGTLVLNNTLIHIKAIDAIDLAAQINQYTPTTGVAALVEPFPTPLGSYKLDLMPARAESFNQTSPFIDLSQNYGSDASRGFFLREYIDAGATLSDRTTGRLLNAGKSINGGEAFAGMANWAQVKANALKIGITLHDADIMAIPLVALDKDNNPILGQDGLPQLVALNKVTGAIVYVKDTNVSSDLVLMTTKHAFLNDMGVRLSANDFDANTRDLSGDKLAALNAHYVSGDGRLNENIGLTAVHEAFLTEHNHVLSLLMNQYGFTGPQPAGGWTWTDPLTNETTKITGEELFQQAKLVLEMEYQHLVFDQFVRKLSPNIAAFAAVNPAINASISSEFANAVYRLGHSMLPEAVGLRQYSDATKFSTTIGTRDITITVAGHGLSDGAQITISNVNAAIRGIAASQINGTFTIRSVTADTFVITAGAGASATSTGIGNATETLQIDLNKGLIDAFLNPQSYTPGATSALLAAGSTSQVGMRIDEKVTDALRDNLLGQPLDLATLNLIRGRDAGLPTLNEMRASIQQIAPLALQPTLTPYTSWTSFRNNLKGTLVEQTATVKNFMMAYASDDLLTKFATSKTLAEWYDLRDSTDSADQTTYMTALKLAADTASTNATWMGTAGNKDFNRIDAWIGGLAEREVVGGMLGSTFDAVFAMQMMNLQNGDKFYYLGRVPAAEFFVENLEGAMLADMVARSTGTKGIYADIFSVADKYIDMGDFTTSEFATLARLQAATTSQSVLNATGGSVASPIGRAGYVGTVFYGNPGNYVDARGVLNPNGVGNASEMITGTANNDRILSGGGNDTVRAEGGNDTIDGGAGVDFLYGGDGNDSIVGGTENDFLYGNAGNDIMRGGLGVEIMFGGDGNDSLFGGLDPDVINGGPGNDVMYGGDGVTVGGVLDPDPAVGAALLDDNMSGGSGDDTIYGGGGWDILNGQTGHDVLIPGAGGIVIGGREAMNGGEGDDIYIVDGTATFLDMNFVDNGLTQLQLVNKGAGFRQGNGLGIDEVRITATVAGDYVLGGTNALGIIQGFSGIERVVIGTGTGATAVRTGTAAINVDAALAVPGINVGLEIWGNAGVNNIIGTAFNDTLDGGAGNDTLEGGIGDDVYIIDSLSDVLNETTGSGNDTIIVRGNFSFTLGSDFENLTLQGTTATSALNGTGNALANIIIGNDGDNILTALGGDDDIRGGGGVDIINAGAGVDTMDGGAGNDLFIFDSVADIGNDPVLIEMITGFEAGDRLVFAFDADETTAGFQNFTFSPNAGSFTGVGQLRFENGILYGNVSGDTAPEFQIAISGASAAGANLLQPTWGSDAAQNMNGTAGTDFIFGFGGADTINGAAGNDFLYGGLGNDTINGGDGNDLLNGGDGNDSLIGGNGNDTIVNSNGADTMTGGAGNDIFLFSPDNGAVTGHRITDFVRGTDRIDLSGIDANTALLGDQSFTYIGNAQFTAPGQIRYAAGVIQGNTTGNNGAEFTITINALPTMAATDFIL